MKNSYLYQTQIDKFNLQNCPPKDSGVLPCKCYHYVFEEIENANNFLPISERNPPRFNNTADKNKCALIGLSCYTDEKEAVDKWLKINKQTEGLFAQQVGKHIVSLSLEKEDGTAHLDKPNSTHFNFYQFSDTVIQKRIIHIKAIDNEL